MSETPKVSYEKSKIAIRHWLMGKGYHRAVRAMDVAQSYHTGTRKDGQPEFSHQVFQAHLLYTLSPVFKEPEEVFIAVFLHDTVEDYSTAEDASPLPPFTLDVVRRDFGERTAEVINRLSKVVEGHKKPADYVFSELAKDPTASLVKAADRIHNHQTMHGAFKPEKRRGYLEETTEHILPMLKAARKNFPEQLQAYEGLKIHLYSQMQLYRALDIQGEPIPDVPTPSF